MLREGDDAPEFEVRGVQNGDIGTYRLSDYTDDGEYALLSFYAFDFNPICTEGMCSLRNSDWFEFTEDLQVLGISGDGVYAHQKFADEHRLGFPLLSDTDLSVAEAYGVLTDDLEGMPQTAQRSVFLVGPDRTVRFAAAVDADSPADIDIGPVQEAVRSIVE